MSRKIAARSEQFQLKLPTSMPEVVSTDAAELEAETQKWAWEATRLYRQYLVAMVATVLAGATLLFLYASPILAPMFGDMYFLGSRSI